MQRVATLRCTVGRLRWRGRGPTSHGQESSQSRLRRSRVRTAGVSNQGRGRLALDKRPDAETMLALVGHVVPEHRLRAGGIRDDLFADIAHDPFVIVDAVGGRRVTGSKRSQQHSRANDGELHPTSVTGRLLWYGLVSEPRPVPLGARRCRPGASAGVRTPHSPAVKLKAVTTSSKQKALILALPPNPVLVEHSASTGDAREARPRPRHYRGPGARSAHRSAPRAGCAQTALKPSGPARVGSLGSWWQRSAI